MITMETNPSFIQFVAWKLGKLMDRKATKEKRVRTFMEAFIQVMLHIVGFSCLTIAGFYWNPIPGLITAGVSCFVLAWLISQSDSNSPNATQR